MKDIILISGGAGNIAQAITRKYLDANCKVISIDIKDKNVTDEFDNNKDYEYYKIDVTDINQIEDLKNKIASKYGRITHLISAAGVPMKSEHGRITDIPIEDIDKSIKLNLCGHIYLTKTFYELMKLDKSTNKSIVFVSSINAIKNFGIPIYSAAKAGIYGFMYGIVKEFASVGIRVNTISPGSIPTEIDFEIHRDIIEWKKKTLLLQDFTTPADIADSIYSITHNMKALVGQNIIIDSGQTLSTGLM